MVREKTATRYMRMLLRFATARRATSQRASQPRGVPSSCYPLELLSFSARRGVDTHRLQLGRGDAREPRQRKSRCGKREIAGCSFTPRMATRARSAGRRPAVGDVATRAATAERERQRRLGCRSATLWSARTALSDRASTRNRKMTSP